MPPSRRRPNPSPGQVPPVRRKKVAGLRNRPATHAEPTEQEATEVTAQLPRVQAPNPARPPREPEPPAEPPKPEPAPEPALGPASDSGPAAWTEPADIDLGTDPEPEPEPEPEPVPAEEPAKEPKHAAPRGQRPAGKRRATGAARPADLSAAEAEAGAKAGAKVAAGTRMARAARPRSPANQYQVAGVLVVLAVVLGGLAVWFRGEADALESGDVNTALTDSATTSEVIGQLTTAIEDTFSYNYTDLTSTQKAVDKLLTGKARCEYDQLFGQVQELAPKQKIIMATAVRNIALVRLDGDRAEALVFIDQSSTRVDVNNSVAGEAQFGVLAHREGDTWKITEFNMFDQPLVNGQPAPKC